MQDYWEWREASVGQRAALEVRPAGRTSSLSAVG